MNVKVALIYSNVVKEPWIPLGLLSIAANLIRDGIQVKILDTLHDNIIKEISSFKPDYVGLGGMTVMAYDAIGWGTIIKKQFPHIKIVFGGVHFTFLPEEAQGIANYIIQGEGEEEFLNIIYGNKVKKGHIENLDSIPFPAYELIDMNKYHDELVTGEKAISIMTGRGCPYDCLFCASPQLYNRRMRYNSIEYVIHHIKYLISNYDLKNLRIMDDTFTCNKYRVLDFCEAILKNNINLKMTCLTNVNNADKETFTMMKKAGFDIVAFGLESIDPKVLKLVNKEMSVDRATQVIHTAHDCGLKTELLFMVGNIGDTKEALENTLAFSKKFNSYKVYFQLATPFPGSKFYDVAEQYGTVVDRDWEHYDHKKVTYIPDGLDADYMKDVVNRGCKN